MPKRLVAEAGALHHARPEILDHHVSLVDQFEYSFEIGGVAQVDLDAALVAIECQERVGFPVRARHEDAVLTHPFAVLLFELDDISAQISQNLRGERTLEQRREVEHTYSLQWTGSLWLIGHCVLRFVTRSRAEEGIGQFLESHQTFARAVPPVPDAVMYQLAGRGLKLAMPCDRADG